MAFYEGFASVGLNWTARTGKHI